jgi:predicted nucleic acid-binding Zn ribbon protein
MLNSSDQLCNITRWRTKKPAEATKLGNVMQELLENRISPLQARLGLITELWERLIPAELRRHYRIAGVSGRVLKVLADSPSFASEMRWYSQNLLKQIREQCPRMGIKDIQCVVGQERS